MRNSFREDQQRAAKVSAQPLQRKPTKSFLQSRIYFAIVQSSSSLLRIRLAILAFFVLQRFDLGFTSRASFDSAVVRLSEIQPTRNAASMMWPWQESLRRFPAQSAFGLAVAVVFQTGCSVCSFLRSCNALRLSGSHLQEGFYDRQPPVPVISAESSLSASIKRAETGLVLSMAALGGGDDDAFLLHRRKHPAATARSIDY